ncbi:hypothetical protein LOAG_01721 [Loa loa]|uniref:Tyrosinase_Cu-bd domain-containing protein n=1 Tax=Loa loa TaxID=7209 RepID=A0A1I7VEA5_LOALO|nr:hypothetical protein LOAG_01721 [Loa loa]EFO26758.1 hypothetical protein LOAG_01721 [Loa loa]
MHLPVLITLLTLLTYSIGTQYKIRLTFCDQAPNSVLQIVCSQLKKWDTIVRQRHSISLNESRPFWSSQKIWSISRSRWASNSQSWTSWSSWTLPHSTSSQVVQYPTNNRVKSPFNIGHRVKLPSLSSLISNFTADTYTSNEPKRMALEIQYEISSLPKQTMPIRIRDGQVTNVKTYSPRVISSLSLSSTFGQRQQILKNDYSNQKLHIKKITNGVQGPPSIDTVEKDLYTMEQDTVGPPGQQRPNNLIRKQFSLSSPSVISSARPSPTRMSDRSIDSPVFSVETQDSRPFKRNQANMMTPPSHTLTVDQRLKALGCMDLNCLCPFFNGSLRNLKCFLSNGKELSMAVRKEYRQLSTEERERFHSALDQLKQSGDYDQIAQWHSNPALSGGAHSGPAFLPWHREYIKRLEIALRLIDPDISLPYWDSTLENAIPESTDTILFSKELMGENDKYGNIINGFISHWTTPEGRHITRHLGQEGRPLNEDDIQAVMRHSDVIGVLAYTAPQPGCRYPTDWTSLEYSHANALVWVGGDMFHQTTSANDPLFFLHHVFVDSIWEYWRQHRQSRDARSKSYPPDLSECSGENHFAQNPMRPFEPLRNIDGIGNGYNERLYRYAPRPACPRGQDQECGSEFLFCDLSHGYARCSTKIRLGGNCNSYTHQENSCYSGFCLSGRCTKNASTDHNDGKQIRSIELSVALISSTATTNIAKEQCYNSHECCSIWASRGECKTNEEMMLNWCPVSCHKCIAQYNTASDCSDRHLQCPVWATQGECQKNQLWMAENCRLSCRRCNKLRVDICEIMTDTSSRG